MPDGRNPEPLGTELVDDRSERRPQPGTHWFRADEPVVAVGPGAYSQFANSLVETSREPFLVLDRNLVIKMANPAFFAAFDLSGVDAIGHGFFDLEVLADEGRELRGLMARVLAEGGGFEDYELSREFPRIGYRCYLLTAQPLQFGGVVRPFILLSFQDVTQQRLVERALQQALVQAEEANRAKSQFLATMSHELRTPLNAIMGFSELMKGQFMGPIGTPVYAEYAADIYDSGSHLLALVNDLLDLARLEAGGREIVEEAVAVGQVVDLVLRTLAPIAEGAKVTVESAIAPDLPPLRADGRAIRQMLTNLVSNAVKYTPAGGRAWIAAQMRSDGLGIEVGDTGVGMPANDVATALQPFGRLHPEGMDRAGTGLGLPIVKSLVELHDGELEIESRPHEGTVVRLIFPNSRILAKD